MTGVSCYSSSSDDMSKEQNSRMNLKRIPVILFLAFFIIWFTSDSPSFTYRCKRNGNHTAYRPQILPKTFTRQNFITSLHITRLLWYSSTLHIVSQNISNLVRTLTLSANYPTVKRDQNQTKRIQPTYHTANWSIWTSQLRQWRSGRRIYCVVYYERAMTEDFV